MIPFLFAPGFTALNVCVCIVMISIFAVGLYLGKLSRRKLLFSGTKMADCAVIITLLVYLIQRLIVPPGASAW